MARKNKKKRKNRLAKSANLPADGQKCLANGQFAEAVRIFRQLYKESEGDKYSKLFHSAFIGRINQLTAKGMHKEALAIFKNMELVFPDTPSLLHINLLIKSGKFQAAVEKYAETFQTITKAQKTELDELLAAHLLSGQTQLMDILAEDSLVRKHCHLAQQALQAYCQEDDDAAYSALSGLTFRSPYKNFSLALKGIIAFHKKRQEALSYFEKIDKNSPFLCLTVPYYQIIEKPEHAEDAGPSAKTAAVDKAVITSIEGLNAEALKFINALDNVPITPAFLYHKLVTLGKFLGRKQLQKICFRILPHAPEKISDFEKKFGRMSSFNFAKISALSLEICDDDYYYDLEDAWQKVCNIITAAENDPDKNLKLALIYQHIAEHMAKDDYEYSLAEVQKTLEKSLEYNAHDKQTWLTLYGLNHQQLAEKYKIVNSMLSQFPEDKEILALAVEATIKRGAFKKASTIAKKLLLIDPLNTKVRLLLIDAHLAHAHKLCKQSKYELACRECKLASSYDKKGLSRGRVQLILGLITLLSGDPDGQDILAEGEKLAECTINAHFFIRLEAELLGMSKKWLTTFTGQLKKYTKNALHKNTLLQLVDAIDNCNGEKYTALLSFKSLLTPCLKKGAKLELSQDEFIIICQTFKRRHFHDLLLHYARTALRKYKKMPIFVFYQAYAKLEGGKKQLSYKLYNELDDAWGEAMNEGDEATATMIDDFLTQNNLMADWPQDFNANSTETIISKEVVDYIGNNTEPSDAEKGKKKNPKQLNLFDIL